MIQQKFPQLYKQLSKTRLSTPDSIQEMSMVQFRKHIDSLETQFSAKEMAPPPHVHINDMRYLKYYASLITQEGPNTLSGE